MKKIEKKAILLESNLNIVSLKGHLVYKSILENVALPRTYIKSCRGKEVLSKQRENTCPLNQSLETKELINHLYNDKSFTKAFTLKKSKDGYKASTNAIINVVFNKALTIGEENEEGKWCKTQTIANEKEIRKYVYRNGFNYNDVKYVLYKRSAGNAKDGKTLFIKEDLYKHMWKWSCLDWDFNVDEKYDISSLYAYSSLSLTNIHDTINIKPKNILLIDDVDTIVKEMASVSELVDGKVKVTNRIADIQSSCFDGQSLIDESIVNSSSIYANKGTILLRNRFFKSNGINTRIQEYYSKNNVKTVYDMFNNPHDAKDILMITTPNSVKWLKFSNEFECDQQCYNYWLDTISDEFGIAKSEPTSKFGEYQRMSYQMVNTLPLSKEDTFELADTTVTQINELNTNASKFIEYIEKDDVTITTKAIIEMLKLSPKFKETVEFNSFKSRYIDKRKKECKNGKLLIKGDNCTIVGNPYAMLVRSHDTNYYGTFLKSNECHCTLFDDSVRLSGFRSPHITMGNVTVLNNKIVDVYNKWFNLTKNCVVINAYETSICQRLQGQDFDSDFMLLTDNKLVRTKAEEVQEFLIPINEVKGTKKLRKLCELNEIDNILHTGAIGLIVNNSQRYNSMLWNTEDKEERQLYYDNASALSSLSQIAIDLSKKMVDGLDLNKEIIRSKANLTPMFFKNFTTNKTKVNEEQSRFTEMSCPMDYLQKVKFARKPYGEGSKSMLDIFKKQNSKNKELQYNKGQIKDIKDLIQAYSDKMTYISIAGVETDSINDIKLELIEKLSKKEVNTTTLYFLIKRVTTSSEWSKIRNMSISCIILAFKEGLEKLL